MVRDKRSAVMKASFVVAVPLALGMVATTASIASAQTDPHVGTWKLNLAKSESTTGPLPQSQTFTYEADGPGLTFLVQGVTSGGKPMNPDKNKTKVTLDGKDYPASPPNQNRFMEATKRIDADSYETIRKEGGKVVQTSTSVVSKDGKTLTLTVKGKNEKGEPYTRVAVYDKQ
jgi:hypothetical protein